MKIPREHTSAAFLQNMTWPSAWKRDKLLFHKHNKHNYMKFTVANSVPKSNSFK